MTPGGATFAFGVPGGGVVAALVALVCVALAVLAVRERSAVPPRVFRVLLPLRLLGLVLAWLVITQPSSLREHVERRPGRLAILVDTSRSMTVPFAGAPRYARLRDLLEKWSGDPAFARASLLRFDSSLAPVSRDALLEAATFDGESTSIAEAVRTLAAEESSDDLGAVVVVSDGAETGTRGEPTASFGGVRVHTVSIADEPPHGDRAITHVAADARAFLRQPYVVRVKVRATERRGGELAVTLFRGDETIERREVPLDEEGEGEARFEVEPGRVGTVFHRVALDDDSRDPIPANDSRAFLVEITRDRLRVLHVAGHPSWDVRFLRSFLKSDSSIDLVAFFILRTNTDMSFASPSEMALIPFPTDELFREHLASFDVVVFQNFDFGPYRMAQYLPAIARYVERGGAFAMVGGDSSFASGGYAGTPLEDVLPVDLPAGGRAAVVTGEFRPTLVEATERHPIVALVANRAENRALFSGLAPLLGMNALGAAREGSQVLLTHESARVSAQPMPLLAVSEHGRGRVAAFASDASFRWGITTGGESGDASAYERFWDRALRWLARDPALEASRVSPERKVVGPRATLGVDVLARDDAYAPIRDRDVTVELRDSADAVAARASVRVDDDGRGRVELRGPSATGAYRVCLVDGRVRAEAGLVVEGAGDELADPRPDPAFLEALARAGNGRFVADARHAPALTELDSTRERSLGVVPYAPFAKPLALVLLVVLFGAEWLLRRRNGLS